MKSVKPKFTSVSFSIFATSFAHFWHTYPRLCSDYHSPVCALSNLYFSNESKSTSTPLPKGGVESATLQPPPPPNDNVGRNFNTNRGGGWRGGWERGRYGNRGGRGGRRGGHRGGWDTHRGGRRARQNRGRCVWGRRSLRLSLLHRITATTPTTIRPPRSFASQQTSVVVWVSQMAARSRSMARHGKIGGMDGWIYTC